MEVTTYCINKGTEYQRFSLVLVEENEVVYHCPKWKTIKAAKNWATKHGYKFVDPA